MRWKGWTAAGAAAVLVTLATAPTAGAADKTAILRKMEQLERQQQAIQQQMEQLRQELGLPEPAAAPAGPATRVEEVERRQDILTDEVRVLKEAMVLPEKKELKSTYGLGPAASKVYGVSQGLSLGGYGEFNYREKVGDGAGVSDEFDHLRLVLYTGYKFNDWIVFNSEIEYEHATTGGGGSVSVEFATLDFLLHPMANLRAGLLLVPMGFINEIHEPPFFHGNVRPQVEQQIIPSTWRANGAGIFGELLPGLEYRTYAITGLDALDFRSSGLRGGRQNGAFEKAEDWAWVGRLDYSPIEMLTVGASAYLGNSGQNQNFIDKGANANDPADDVTFKPDVFTQIYEAHAQFRGYGLELRALGAFSSIEDAAELSLVADQTIGGQQYGWYAEAAYDVLPWIRPGTRHYLAPWVRYSQFDTLADVPDGFADDETQDREIWEVGLSYKPITQVIIKADYRNQNSDGGELADEIRLGAGFAF
ncbi:MAG TPA: hypothetical protein VEC57_17865 [Candidatus Limnocylindrales bacterium]|nr:hypothetical protein [Candidatus Limnocylindrales bacterium]